MTTATWTHVTDGGLETDLIFHRGLDLPEFAAFPLLENRAGRAILGTYYDGYAAIAAAVGAGLYLEAPTWRANPDWAARLGYSGARLSAVNVAAIEFLRQLRDEYADRVDDIVLCGSVGPRGDGYLFSGGVEPAAAAEYHLPQLAAFAQAGAALAAAYTLTDPGEALGIVAAGASVGLPVAISFTVETTGRLASGHTVAEAIALVDAGLAGTPVAASPGPRPDWAGESAPGSPSDRPIHYLLNCAHPSHIAVGLADLTAEGAGRVRGLRCNASARSHAELDESPDLDEGVPAVLGREVRELAERLGSVTVVGGCCGTDSRHVAEMWAPQ